MAEPENTKELTQNLEEFGQIIKDVQRKLSQAREMIINNAIGTERISESLGRAAMTHGMDCTTASNYAGDFRAVVLSMLRDTETAQEMLGGVQNHLGSAEHIVVAVVHRAPHRPVGGSMVLR